ncbi:MAG: DUF1722 domain-containing protein [Bacillota bacterium]
MRVWDLHPGYLSRQSLLGQHAEIHALFTILGSGKKGYSLHPETLRWKGKLGRLKRVHDLTVLEMELRGFNHASPLALCSDLNQNKLSFVDQPVEQIAILHGKYFLRNQAGRIPLPKNIYELWAHHKYSVMARGYEHYKNVRSLIRNNNNCSLEKAGSLPEQIIKLLYLPVTAPALENVVDHLWGYLKREASYAEKERYLGRQTGDLPALVSLFFDLACKYNCKYLQHSTIFADLTE